MCELEEERQWPRGTQVDIWRLNSRHFPSGRAERAVWRVKSLRQRQA